MFESLPTCCIIKKKKSGKDFKWPCYNLELIEYSKKIKEQFFITYFFNKLRYFTLVSQFFCDILYFKDVQMYHCAEFKGES